MKCATQFSPAAGVVVVGAGPAGMMAALSAADAGAPVTIIEQLPLAGTKLCATGGGRCNLANTRPLDAVIAAFGRGRRFVRHALQAFDAGALRRFLAQLNVPTEAPDGVHVFPVSHAAAQVRDALLQGIMARGAQTAFGERVDGLDVSGDRGCGVRTDKRGVPAAAVVLAAGGASWPSLGATGSGFDIARQAGHTIVTPVPALVGLVTRETWPGTLAGVVIPHARVTLWCAGVYRDTADGALLFTHHGVSGPSVLDLSGEAAAALARGDDVRVKVNAAPAASTETWRERLNAWRSTAGRRSVGACLAGDLPRSFVDALCRAAGVDPGVTCAQVTREQARDIAAQLSGCVLGVAGTEGFARAMATRGGVALSEVQPATLASRRVGALFLAGEVLDVDGPCGGYNLMWAFASGRAAGAAAGGLVVQQRMACHG